MTQNDKKYMILTQKQQQTVEKYLPDEKIMQRISDFFDALSDLTRIKILCALSIADMCVTDLCEVLQMNQTTLSHQLARLRGAGVVTVLRKGKMAVYSIKNKRVWDVFSEAVCTIDEN